MTARHVREGESLLARPPEAIPEGPLSRLREQAAGCVACPIGRHATRTVFGVGPARARAMLVGEQPGNDEDLSGVPFVGAAGRLLDEALDQAGLDRRTLYLTNAVKHFKFEPRGKARLHKRANTSEQAICRMWLAAELARIRPRFVVALGAMAAQSFFGPSFRITADRGRWLVHGSGTRLMATWHPAAILRARRPGAAPRGTGRGSAAAGGSVVDGGRLIDDRAFGPGGPGRAPTR